MQYKLRKLWYQHCSQLPTAQTVQQLLKKRLCMEHKFMVDEIIRPSGDSKFDHHSASGVDTHHSVVQYSRDQLPKSTEVKLKI